MPGVIVDGNDLLGGRRGVASRPSSAPARGEGPTLIECKTYRHRGHSKSDRNRYRTKEEIEDWMRTATRSRCFEARAAANSASSTDDEHRGDPRRRSQQEIADGIEFAKASPIA